MRRPLCPDEQYKSIEKYKQYRHFYDKETEKQCAEIMQRIGDVENFYRMSQEGLQLGKRISDLIYTISQNDLFVDEVLLNQIVFFLHEKTKIDCALFKNGINMQDPLDYETLEKELEDDMELMRLLQDPLENWTEVEEESSIIDIRKYETPTGPSVVLSAIRDTLNQCDAMLNEAKEKNAYKRH